MKKNRFIKIAAVVFTLCLITTCGISSTLAKYTTSSSASDTARVAKWGVEVSASGTMFGKAYQTTIVEDGKTEATVQSNHNVSYAQNVVAPGTQNTTGIQIKILGTPEVEFNLQAAITQNAQDIVLKQNIYGVMLVAPGVNAATDFAAEKIYHFDGTNYIAADLTYYLANQSSTYYRLTDECVLGADYYPVAWTASVSVDGNYYQQIPAFETLEAALNALVDGINNYDGTTGTAGSFDPNTNVNLVYTLGWSWGFEVNNAADTILGNLMAAAQGTFSGTVVKLTGSNYVAIADSDYNLSVGAGFSVRATQVQ